MPRNRLKHKLPSDPKPELLSPSCLDASGKIRWLDDGNDGFDPAYKREEIYLTPGEIIIRYGNENGRYAAPVNTPYTKLALPYKIRSVEYNEYVVKRPVRVIKVDRGVTAKQPAWPSETGGGTQYYFLEGTVLSYVGRALKRLDVSQWSPILAEDIRHQ